MSCRTACRTALTAMSFCGVTLLSVPMLQAQLQSGSPKTVTGQVSAVAGEFQMTRDTRGEDIVKMIDKSYTVTTPTGPPLYDTVGSPCAFTVAKKKKSRDSMNC